MDRNAVVSVDYTAPGVALRKESVDRNFRLAHGRVHARASLSARRAWIEICHAIALQLTIQVALRKESVDRNAAFLALNVVDWLSLSARRAWIEISWPM